MQVMILYHPSIAYLWPLFWGILYFVIGLSSLLKNQSFSYFYIIIVPYFKDRCFKVKIEDQVDVGPI
jgi:hypothetical protein